MKHTLYLNALKKIGLCTFFLLFYLTNQVKSQYDYLDFDVDITDASSTKNQGGIILVNIDDRESRYTFILYDKDPWQGGKKIAEGKSSTDYSFTDLSTGNYFVCVQNRDKVTRCKNVKISGTHVAHARSSKLARQA